jgi:Calx-beta domain/WD40-like Beta Propeller Repeat
VVYCQGVDLWSSYLKRISRILSALLQTMAHWISRHNRRQQPFSQPAFTASHRRSISLSSLATGAVVLVGFLLNPNAGAAQAQSPPTGLISVNRFGNGSGNQAALNNALSFSADGRYVAFVSDATDLTANDTNNSSDVFVRDRQTGQTILVSVNAAGTGPGDQYSRAPTITSDGRYVAFISASSNLVMDDAATLIHEDVYVRDLQLGSTTLVSRNFAGTARGNSTSGWYDPLGISADGRFVVFSSSATDLVATPDNNIQTDVFVRDLQTHTTRLISINRNGTASGNYVSDGGVITPDGRFVAFLSQSRDLIAMDIGFRRQVFLRELETGITKLVSVNRTNTSGGNGDTDPSHLEHDLSISADGRFVAFVSDASDLVNGDTNFTQDVFVRDTQLGVTQLGSINTSGNAGGNSGQISLTPDGHFITFVSGADDLVSNDANQQQDVFIRDLQTNSTSLVSVNRTGVAAGTGDSSTFFLLSYARPSLSDDGRYISFTSKAADLISGKDTNGGNSGASLPDVFVRDRQAGITNLVSINNSGTDSGNGTSAYSAITHDGRSIFYFSGAADLVGYDSNGGVQDLFVFLNVQQTGQVRFKTAVTNAAESGGAATVTVSLTGPLNTPASVNFGTTDGTATSGADYTSTSGTLSFAPGETEKTFAVPIIDDSLNEDDETLVLKLTSPSSNLLLGEPSTAVLKIIDDDPLPTIAIDDVTVGEGDSGTTNAVFRITLSAATGRTVTVPISTQPGTATSGTDFRSLSGSLTFPPGQTVRQVAVAVIGDTTIEGTETFFVNLGTPTNALIARGQGVGTIIDDDALILLTEANSQRAIALDSVLFTRDPFPVTNTLNFSSDQRTRIMLFAIGLKLLPGENASAVTATAEDSSGNVSPLSVEFIGEVPSFNWLTQVILKLNDQPTSGDAKVKITLHSVSSNAVLVGVQP